VNGFWELIGNLDLKSQPPLIRSTGLIQMTIYSDTFNPAKCIEDASIFLTPFSVVLALVVVGIIAFLLGAYIKRRREYITTLISAADGVPITDGQLRLKLCPQCMRGYLDSSLNYCLHDGSRLDENVTAQIQEAPETLLLPTLPGIKQAR
jgi:hypothetical protein